MSLNENKVFQYSKEILENNNYQIIAEDPPSGSGFLPFLEIKEISNIEKGSEGSYKPDIVAANKDEIIVVECKGKFAQTDVEKLIEIKFDENRNLQLYKQFIEKKLLEKFNLNEKFLSKNYFSKSIKLIHSYSNIVIHENKFVNFLQLENRQNYKLYFSLEEGFKINLK